MKWRRNKSLPRRWQRNQLVNRFGAICQICTEPFESAKDITIDHIMPLSKGGEDTFENYQLAHDQCNQLKADMTPEEFDDFQLGKVQYQ